jgi:hypothetical protein
MFCYIEVRHSWMLPRTSLVFAHSVLGSNYLRFRGSRTPSCRPICYCTGPVISCRIVRRTTSMPALAPSVAVLCPDCLTGNAMFCYIEVRRGWMLPRTSLVFALSVLGSDFLRFRGGRTPSYRPTCCCTGLVTCCRIVRQIVSMPAFAPSVTILCPEPSGRKCNVLLYRRTSRLDASENTSDSFRKWLKVNCRIFIGAQLIGCLHASL